MTSGNYYQVYFDSVRLRSDDTLFPAYSTTIKAEDKVAPSIANVTAVTNAADTNVITVEFNEYVTFDMVKIGDVAISTISPSPSTYAKKYTLTLPATADNLEAGKSYNVTFVALRDLAGNFATNPLTASFNVVKDDVKPTFTLNPVNPKQFDIVFDKDMDDTYSVNPGDIVVKNASGIELLQANLPALQADGRTYRVTLMESPIAAGSTSAEISVTVKNLPDYVGNVVATKTTKVTLSKESVKPEITAVRFYPGTSNIELTFSEPVSGIEISDFILTDSELNIIPITSVSSTTNVYNKVTLNVTLTKNDTYTLAFKVNSVEDTSGNKNNAQSFKLTYSDATVTQLTATITGLSLGSSAANRIVKVTYNTNDVINGINPTTGNYKDGAADNPANYTLNGLALPAGTVVTFTNHATNDYVDIDFSGVDPADLPSALLNGGYIIIGVSGVKTASGSTVAYTSQQLAVADETKPYIKAAYLTGDFTNGYTLTVYMSEEVNNLNNASVADFALFYISNGSKTNISIDAYTLNRDATDHTKLTMRIDTVAEKVKINNAINNGYSMKLYTAATPSVVTDKASTPNTMKVDTVNGVSITNYGTADATAPTVQKVEFANGSSSAASTIDAGDTIVITFSEATNKPILAATDFTVSNSHGFGTGATFAWNAAGTVLTITLGTGVDLAEGDTIRLTTGSTITDLAGNNFGTGTMVTIPADTNF